MIASDLEDASSLDVSDDVCSDDGASDAPSDDESRNRLAKATGLLRAAGGLILLASASTFLLQHWQAGDGVERYFLLLGHTVLLALAGLGCGLVLHETKSARTFLMVALAGAPVHFQVLGGLIYSRFAWDGGPPSLSGPFSWVAPTGSGALAALAIAAPILATVMLLGFRVLARPRAGLLTLAFGTSVALMLLPIRLADGMAAVLALQIALALAVFARLSRDSRLATFEGRIARTTLVVPPILILARTAVLYAATPPFRTVVWAGVSAALLALARHFVPKDRIRLEVVALLPLAMAVTEAIPHALHLLGVDGIGALALGLVFAAVLLGLAAAGAGGSVYPRTAAWAAVVAGIVQLVTDPGPGTGVACLVVSLGVVVGAFLLERKAILLVSLAGSVLGLGVALHEAARLFSVGRWAGLALAGIAAIVGAALLERHGPRLWTWFGRARSRIAAW